MVDFLNSMLPVHHQIAELNFKNTEQLGQTVEAAKRFMISIAKAPQVSCLSLNCKVSSKNILKTAQFTMPLSQLLSNPKRGETGRMS